MQRLSKLANGQANDPNSEAFTRLSGAYERVLFKGGASQDDRDIVVTDLAVFTRHFFQDGPETRLEEIHQNIGKRTVMSRLIRLGFGEEVNLSSLYEAAVAETAKTQG